MDRIADQVDQLWQRIMRPLLFRLDPEQAHRLSLAMLAATPGALAGLAAGGDDGALAQTLWGLDFANPVGLAAGLDKDARALAIWPALGLGFVEIGTVTPRPQPGNPAPRLWRIPEQGALINRLGFPSQGMYQAALRIRRERRRAGRHQLIGVNLGPNKERAEKLAAEDLATLASLLGPLADFIVINVSSPNTPGLRAWQAPEQLRALIEGGFGRVAAPALRRPPLLVKIAPDLDSSQVRDLCGAALELGLAGIVATNTTLAREAAGVRSEHAGGLSGQPLQALARRTIRQIYRATAGRLPIIGVGGVASAADAYAHIQAGASLVELYTGLIYEGPGLPRRIKDGMLQLMCRDRLGSIREAIGRQTD